MNINGKWYSETELQAYVNKLLARIDELESKHYNECAQIAHYDIIAELEQRLEEYENMIERITKLVDQYEFK